MIRINLDTIQIDQAIEKKRIYYCSFNSSHSQFTVGYSKFRIRFN